MYELGYELNHNRKFLKSSHSDLVPRMLICFGGVNILMNFEQGLHVWE